MLKPFMIKISIILFAFLLQGCVNKRGVSLEYNADCQEYYDLQGYYHKKCDDEIITYQGVKDSTKKAVDYAVELVSGEEKKPKPNVW